MSTSDTDFRAFPSKEQIAAHGYGGLWAVEDRPNSKYRLGIKDDIIMGDSEPFWTSMGRVRERIDDPTDRKWRPMRTDWTPRPWSELEPAKVEPKAIKFRQLTREIIEANPDQMWERKGLRSPYTLRCIVDKIQWKQDNIDFRDWFGAFDELWRPICAVTNQPMSWDELKQSEAKSVPTGPRFKVGDKVKVCADVYGKQGQIGVIIQSDISDVPYFIKFDDEAHLWFKAEQVRAAPVEPVKPTSFNVGDVVICQRFNTTEDGYTFVDYMEPFVGQEGIVVEVLGANVRVRHSNNKVWRWCPKALSHASVKPAEAKAPTVGRVPTFEEIEAHEKAHGGRWKADYSQGNLSLWSKDGKAVGWYAHDHERSEHAWLVDERKNWLSKHSLQPVNMKGEIVPWPEPAKPGDVISIPMSGPITVKFNGVSIDPFTGIATLKTKETKDMPAITIPSVGATVPTATADNPKKSRNRRAIDVALFRSPVEWTIDQAHEFVVYLLERDIAHLPKAERDIIQGWAVGKLKSAYGRAALGIFAGNIAPIAASYLSQASTVIEEASDKVLEYGYTTAFKEIGTDFVKFIGKPGMRKLKALYNGMTKGVERAEKVRSRQIEAPAIDPLAALKDEPVTYQKRG